MNREEAIRAFKQGKKMTHRMFSDGEFVFLNADGMYEFEDGHKMSHFDFWQMRNSATFQNDWSEVEECKCDHFSECNNQEGLICKKTDKISIQSTQVHINNERSFQ